ncbi:hypothetical protein [uncultured Nitratireductor sp.]|uniref:hypothetical protein n=1 Tax=uncultured Nitratireductor sp. TaxID=520953 RepID=UPI0026234B15|nr:hypothetical protein [uncultured Nitratireductor sp.]
MNVWTKRGVDIVAPTDAAGNPRKVINGEMQTWMTEVERLFNTGAFNSVDAVGLYADRSTFDAEAEGFVYVSIDGDGAGSSSAVVFIKESAASGDWSPPVPFQGDKGWSPLFRVASDGARRVLEVYDWVGGDGEKPTSVGFVGATGLTPNIAEAIDIRGPQGVSGTGLSWNFDNGTADADPGAGKLRADAADLSAATELFVSKTSAGGDPVASFLAGLTNSTSTHKGYLIVTDPSTASQVTFDVTGMTDAAGYVKLAVSGHSGVLAFDDAALLSVIFSRTGNAGDLNGVNPGSAGLAVLEAETVGDVAGIIGNFASRSDAAASSLRVAPDYIRTAGYAEAGDGGGALYKKVASEPSHEGKFPTTLDDGVTVVWYELAPDNLNFRQFGVHPDNTAAENRAALQDGVDYAGALAAANDAPQEIKLPAGRYLWGNGAYDAIADWRHIVFVPDNVVIGGTGTLVSSTHFSNRSVGFVVRGDNVIVQDVSFLDTYTATSNWIIPVGAGTSYDSGLTSGRTYENLVVRRCTFNNAWLSVSVQFAKSLNHNERHVFNVLQVCG